MSDQQSSPWVWHEVRAEYYYTLVRGRRVYQSGTIIILREPMWPAPSTPPGLPADQPRQVPGVPPTTISQGSNRTWSTSSGGSASYDIAHDVSNLSLHGVSQHGNTQQNATQQFTRATTAGSKVDSHQYQVSYAHAQNAANNSHSRNTAQTHISTTDYATFSSREGADVPETRATVTQSSNDQWILGQLGRNLDSEPKNLITQPELLELNVNIEAHRRLRGSPRDREKLDPSYKVRKPGYDSLKVGKVVKIFWPELAGWFVVVKEGRDCCSCLAIQSFGRIGVTSNKVKAHYAIIYTGTNPPDPLPTERPRGSWEMPMGEPIRVVARKQSDKLDSLSRVNFIKIYTVEHNVKVYDFGQVHPEWESLLVHQFNSAWGINSHQGSARSIVNSTVRRSSRDQGRINTGSGTATTYTYPINSGSQSAPYRTTYQSPQAGSAYSTGSHQQLVSYTQPPSSTTSTYSIPAQSTHDQAGSSAEVAGMERAAMPNTRREEDADDEDDSGEETEVPRVESGSGNDIREVAASNEGAAAAARRSHRSGGRRR